MKQQRNYEYLFKNTISCDIFKSQKKIMEYKNIFNRLLTVRYDV